MESIQKLILKNIEAALGNATSLASVGPGRLDDKQWDRPCAGFFPDDEETALEPESSELNVMNLVVRVLVDEEDEVALYELEDVLMDVEKAIKADPTRGGLAEHTRKTGRHYLYVDRELPRAGADVMFAIRYQTEESDPSQQNFIGPGIGS